MINGQTRSWSYILTLGLVLLPLPSAAFCYKLELNRNWPSYISAALWAIFFFLSKTSIPFSLFQKFSRFQLLVSLTLKPDSFPKCIFWKGLEKSILWGGLYYSSGLKESRKLQYSLWNEYTYSNFSCPQQFHVNNFIYTTLMCLVRSHSFSKQ